MPSRRLLLIHPDLGIGGAERLCIDAAVGLQDLGYDVVVYTSHCDPQHCFDEARNGKWLGRSCRHQIVRITYETIQELSKCE